ncbi:rhodanese-like domain-containing protein [Nocardioides donggukensis]|uniref:Rhodanese-like domain-containing protein n=1 Tax=Nocardioides donggukensis TaxID=2774019 RepID=A0A927K694_9ACTN|nr:rhodanese-like domain-containing protein [Nocardioides donggukensis]MBD8871087.1 rhodanese-like domain-containing protein [Nocardioides donggukensis]
MRETDIAGLEAALEDGATLVDVREPDEYAEGHVPGARPIPMGQLPARLGELDRERPVFVICASGNRSSAMAEVLDQAGFDAVNVAGGTGAWQRSGRPVQTR